MLLPCTIQIIQCRRPAARKREARHTKQMITFPHNAPLWRCLPAPSVARRKLSPRTPDEVQDREDLLELLHEAVGAAP